MVVAVEMIKCFCIVLYIVLPSFCIALLSLSLSLHYYYCSMCLQGLLYFFLWSVLLLLFPLWFVLVSFVIIVVSFSADIVHQYVRYLVPFP